MNVSKMKLAEIKKPEANIRIHTQNQLKEYARSIKMFGQIRPIVIDENNVIICGVGLYEALELAGAKSASIFKIEGLTDNQKKKLMIADNKIFGLGIDDLATLNQFIEELTDDLDIPGFDEDILRSMVADAEEVTNTLAEYGTISSEEIEAINASKERKDGIMSNAPAEGENTEHTTEERESVTCPECGAVVWL